MPLTRRVAGGRLAAAAALAFILTGCNGGVVDRHALKRDAEQVGSLAAEGQLLAKDVARGASTRQFARVHARELSRAASDLEDALARRPTAAGIAEDVRELSRLAGKVSDELEQLGRHPADAALANSVERPLQDAVDAAEELAR